MTRPRTRGRRPPSPPPPPVDPLDPLDAIFAQRRRGDINEREMFEALWTLERNTESWSGHYGFWDRFLTVSNICTRHLYRLYSAARTWFELSSMGIAGLNRIGVSAAIEVNALPEDVRRAGYTRIIEWIEAHNFIQPTRARARAILGELRARTGPIPPRVGPSAQDEARHAEELEIIRFRYGAALDFIRRLQARARRRNVPAIPVPECLQTDINGA